MCECVNHLVDVVVHALVVKSHQKLLWRLYVVIYDSVSTTSFVLMSVWVALLHAVRARQGDLAMLRMLGAPARRVAALVALEALLLAGLATVLGLAVGHGLVAVLAQLLAQRQSLRLGPLGLSDAEWLVPLLAGGLALLAAAWPAWRAYRLDVTTLLQAPR